MEERRSVLGLEGCCNCTVRQKDVGNGLACCMFY